MKIVFGKEKGSILTFDKSMGIQETRQTPKPQTPQARVKVQSQSWGSLSWPHFIAQEGQHHSSNLASSESEDNRFSSTSSGAQALETPRLDPTGMAIPAKLKLAIALGRPLSQKMSNDWAQSNFALRSKIHHICEGIQAIQH